MAKWSTDPAEADALFARAYAIFSRISQPLAQTSFHCQSNFAMTLGAHARMAMFRGDVDEGRRLLRLAGTCWERCVLWLSVTTCTSVCKLRPLLARGDAWAAFCLARLHAVAHRVDACRVWLERCAHRNYLGTRVYVRVRVACVTVWYGRTRH
jgi:hypothetical protein